jgi:hypothetical protein
MRAFVALCLALGLAATAAPAAAQEAEALRRELEQLRQQFELMKEQYQKAIDTMTERLQRLEARPMTAAAPPAAPKAGGFPSWLELARPREPFALYAQGAAAGEPGAPPSPRSRFLFDIGIAGDFVGNITPDSAERNQTGTFAGRENRIFPREIELSLFGQIDPYARGEVRIEAAEEFEGGERLTEVTLAEAHLTLVSLPFGFQVKGGLMRPRFGYVNEFHLHDRPWIDSPAVTNFFFGEEGLRESGVEVVWVAPLPIYLQAILGVFDGDNEEAFGRGSLRDPLVTGRLRTFFDLGGAGALQLGVSGATGVTELDERANYLGVDAKYKYIPSRWSHPLLTLGGEIIFADRKIPTGGDEDGTEAELGRRLRQEAAAFKDVSPYGYYVWAEVQPWKQLAFGARYDYTEFPDGSGDQWAIGPYVSWMPSEFLRFRIGYKFSDRKGLEPTDLNEFLFQATFILGAHPAHPF